MRIRDELYSVTGDNKGTKYTPMMTHIDLCIGKRVRLIRQISVELGLYNGAMGTVYGPDKVADTTDATIKFCDLEDDDVKFLLSWFKWMVKIIPIPAATRFLD